jgi:hypothetical protein
MCVTCVGNGVWLMIREDVWPLYREEGGLPAVRTAYFCRFVPPGKKLKSPYLHGDGRPHWPSLIDGEDGSLSGCERASARRYMRVVEAHVWSSTN